MLLAIAPDVFHWVKFRRIRRQELQFNRPTLRGDKLSHQPTAMNRQTVPNESQSTADVTLQMFQKLELAGPLARLYVDALDALEHEALQRSQGLDRDEALALVEQVIEQHGEVSAVADEPVAQAATTR